MICDLCTRCCSCIHLAFHQGILQITFVLCIKNMVVNIIITSLFQGRRKFVQAVIEGSGGILRSEKVSETQPFIIREYP